MNIPVSNKAVQPRCQKGALKRGWNLLLSFVRKKEVIYSFGI